MIELNKDQIRRIMNTLSRLHRNMADAEDPNYHTYLAGKTRGINYMLHEIGYVVCYDKDHDGLYLRKEIGI